MVKVALDCAKTLAENNIDAEVDRLKKLGATVFEKKEKWVVLEAPTGHRFCVVNPQRDDFDTSNQVNYWN